MFLKKLFEKNKNEWPFEDAPNTRAFTFKSIVNKTKPILYVSRDSEGDWQFMDGGTPDMTDATIVALSEIVEVDPSVKELSNLKSGMKAARSTIQDKWKIYK